MANPDPDSAGLRTTAVLRMDAGGCAYFDDRVIEEVPVAFLYNGTPFAVMMATPCDLADFALGFALSEGIVGDPREFELVDALRTEHGIALQALIPADRFEALHARRRNLTGRSGCGLCGAETLEEAIRPVRRVASDIVVRREAVTAALAQLAATQPLNARSGGVHAAAFASGGSLTVREDVGRHNALDKLVGALGRDASAMAAMRDHCGRGLLAITSRASYEIVHKAASAGIAVIAAVSAPTSLAVRLAEQANVTLIAFARGSGMNVYTHPRRVTTG
jgi:FdhD protein